MKASKSVLALSILAASGSANATIWTIHMSGNSFVGSSGVQLNFTGFVGTWDDVSNTGQWTGETTIPQFVTTMHYTQTFTMDENTGLGRLNIFSACTDNTGSACQGLLNPLSGVLLNTVVEPTDPNEYKKKLPFSPTDGWAGQWTLQAHRAVIDPVGNTSIEYVPIAFDVTIPAVPVPAAAWLFGSGLAGLFASTRRRRAA